MSPLTRAGYTLVFPAPGRQPSEAELLEYLPECVGYLAGVEPVSARVLQACNKLKVIARNGVGVDNVDLEAAKAKGIAVERAIGANSRGVAELAITLMLNALRWVEWSDRNLKTGDWKRSIGREARGRVVGVVGCGAIGRTVAELSIGLGMTVIGYDPYPTFPAMPGFRWGSLDEVWAGAEVVSLHCPPGKTPLVDAAAIGKMKTGMVLVNTARADLLDDDAVLAALKSKKIAALATDVFRAEPPELSELLRHENVILTPHIGGFTEESVDRATSGAVENILKVLESR